MKKIFTLLVAFVLCSSLAQGENEFQIKALAKNKNKFQVGAAVGVTNHFFKGDSITYPISGVPGSAWEASAPPP